MLIKAVFAVLFTAQMSLCAMNEAAAGPVSGLGSSLQRGIIAAYIIQGSPTLAPFAQVRFCVNNPADCERASGQAVVNLTAEKRHQLQRINSLVNRAIRAVKDSSGSDEWTASGNSGDCEDFALTKRRKLVALGWSARSLRMAVAHTSSGEGHAVLVVKTSQGDLVLDNRTNEVRPFNRTSLKWVKIQSGENPRLWFDL